jgi:hypothetical protein
MISILHIPQRALEFEVWTWMTPQHPFGVGDLKVHICTHVDQVNLLTYEIDLLFPDTDDLCAKAWS